MTSKLKRLVKLATKNNGESEREMHKVSEGKSEPRGDDSQGKETKRHPVAWPPPLTFHPYSKIRRRIETRELKE